MFIELVDSLRCPRAHADSWLVGAFDRMDGRAILRGSLGCPVCDARYPIRDGVVYFDDAPEAADAAASTNTATSTVQQPRDDRGVYLGALLGLADAHGLAVLEGEWTRHAVSLRALTTIPLILLNPASDTEPLEGVAAVRSRDSVPIAAGSARGIALSNQGAAHAGIMLGAVRALAPLGRLLAPVPVGVPAEIRELARDSECWVGERESAVSAPVTLSRTGQR